MKEKTKGKKKSRQPKGLRSKRKKPKDLKGNNGRLSIGYIYQPGIDNEDDILLLKALKEKMEVVLLPLPEQIDLSKIKELTQGCKVILNNSEWSPQTWESLELSKTFEEMGKKVIESSHSYYYQEDKWMFYLKCLENKLPTPLTYLIPKGSTCAPRFIKELLENKPVVLKAVFSEMGLCVEKVKRFEDYAKAVKKIADRNPLSPIIAQEYITSSNKCYRATLINHKLE